MKNKKPPISTNGVVAIITILAEALAEIGQIIIAEKNKKK